MCVKVFERLCLFSGASDQRDFLLSQPARPSAVELRAAGGGAPLQSEYLQFAKVFGRTSHWMLLVRVRFCVDAFGVFLTCSPADVLWVDPPALQANLSLLTSPVDDNFVSVTAVVGKNESEEAPADGIQFSYVRDTLVKHKCEWLVVKTKTSPEVFHLLLCSLRHQALWTSRLLLSLWTRMVTSCSTSSIRGCRTAPVYHMQSPDRRKVMRKRCQRTHRISHTL